MNDLGWGAAIRFFLIGAGMVALWFLIWPAQAAPMTSARCGVHDQIVRALAKVYQEAPRAIGTVSHSHFMQVYVSRAGSWTILVTSANRISCIVAAGQDWEDVPHKPGQKS